jgi:hypothetical protein
MSAKEIFDQIVAGNKEAVRDLYGTSMSERAYTVVSDMRQQVRLAPQSEPSGETK